MAVNCANYPLCRRGWLSIVRLDHEAIPLAAIYSLGQSLLRNRGLAAKHILLDLARRCFWQLGHNHRGQTNDEARMTNDEGMTKHECNVLALARARNRMPEV